MLSLGFKWTTIFVCASLSTGSIASAAEDFAAATRPDFSKLESPSLHIFSDGECNADYFMSELERQQLVPDQQLARQEPFIPFDWVPTAIPTRLEVRNCEPERLQALLAQAGSSAQAHASALNRFFADCETPLRWGAPRGTKAIFNLSQIVYRFCENPSLRKVMLTLPNGDRVRGILGLKSDSSPRPLVIAKCGVLCNAGDSAMRFILMHLFDESPFNLLLLANATGADYVRDNAYFVPGGFKEGQHIIYAAELLRKSALAPRISSVHSVGVSLGGHASLYAAFLNPYQHGEKGEPLLRSTLAACPVVNLNSSMHDLFEFSLKGTLAQFMFKSSIDKVLSTHPELAPLFNWWNAPRWERPDRIADQAATFLRNKGRDWALPPFNTVSIRDRGDFWSYSQFSALASANPIHTPTLALASEDDEVVNPNTNIKTLAKANLPAVVLPFGDHCAINQIYGWRTASTIFQGYILSMSPEFSRRARLDSVALPPTEPPSQTAPELHGVTRFSFASGQNALTITQQFFIGTPKNDCGRENPYFARLACYREAKRSVPFENLAAADGKLPWWAHMPATVAEAEALTRWANVNLRLADENNRTVDGTPSPGRRITWTAYGAEL